MRRGQGGRLSIPTESQLAEQIEEGREIVACSGARFGPLSALSIVCHNADIATLGLDEYAAGCLVGVLKALFPDSEKVRATVVTEGVNGVQAQAGHMSA
jgi:hypothetical protein